MSKSVDFSADLDVSDNNRDPSRKSFKGTSKRRSSFFNRLSASFRRSDGERGADVDTLRGTHGPDFEGYAVIKRGDDGGIDCGCFGGGKDSKEKLVLVKGPFAFVFTNEFDDAPKYAMALANLKPVSKGSHGSSYLVTLETNLGDVEYEFSFEKEALAKEFVEAVEKQAAIGLNEQIRKRLGHENLLKKGKSIRYAEKVAMKKIESQPEKEVRVKAEEIERGFGGAGIVGV